MPCPWGKFVDVWSQVWVEIHKTAWRLSCDVCLVSFGWKHLFTQVGSSKTDRTQQFEVGAISKQWGGDSKKSLITASWNLSLRLLLHCSSINSIWRWWSALSTSLVKGLAKTAKVRSCVLKSEKRWLNSSIIRFSLAANQDKRKIVHQHL